MPLYGAIPAPLRNDALTPQKYSRVRDNWGWLQEQFGVEHVFLTGEHNSPVIARTLGTVNVAGGPTYTLQDFNADASLSGGAGAYNPAVGRLIITLPGSPRYQSPTMAAWCQNASATGVNAPCLTAARVVGDDTVEFYSYTMNAGLNVAQTWVAEDATFFAGIHSLLISPGAPSTFGGLRTRGQGLRSADLSQLIQGQGDVVQGFAATHKISGSIPGAHNTREIARTVAAISWDSTNLLYRLSMTDYDSPAAAIDSIAYNGTGQLTVSLAGDVGTNIQVFATPLYVPSVGADGFIDSIGNVCVPKSNISNSSGRTTFDVFLYVSGIHQNLAFNPPPTDQRWGRGDFNFTLRIHAAPA